MSMPHRTGQRVRRQPRSAGAALLFAALALMAAACAGDSTGPESASRAAQTGSATVAPAQETATPSPSLDRDDRGASSAQASEAAAGATAEPAEGQDDASADSVSGAVDVVSVAPPETVPPETVPPETVPPETVPPETVPPETVPPETVSPETVPPETVSTETLSTKTVSPDPVTPETVPEEPEPEPLPESLMGADRDALIKRLGPPALLRREPPAEFWQFAGDGCVLHVFLYESETTALYEVTHVELLPRGGLDVIPPGCFSRMLFDRRRSAG